MNRRSVTGFTLDPDQLILGGIGLLFVLVGIGLLFIFGTKVTLDCDRSRPPAGICTLRTTGMFSRHQSDFAIAELQRAVVDVSYGEDGDTYRVVLVTDNGNVALTGYYSSGASAKEKAADQINAYLKYDGQQTVSVSLDDRIFSSIMAGLFSGMGALMLFFAVLKTIQFNRETLHFVQGDN